MMHLVLPYLQGRPLIEVHVGVGQFIADGMKVIGRHVPPPVRLTLLVDSGAEVTFLDQTVIRRMNLRRSGSQPVNTGSSGMTPVYRDEYEIALDIIDPASGALGFRDPSLIILATDLRAQGIDGLLGRDVLDQGVATFHGPKQTLILDL